MHRLLPLVIIVLVVLGLAYNFQPVKRTLAYKFGFSGDTNPSCCQVADIERASGKFDESSKVAIFNGEVVDYPKTSLAQAADTPSNTKVLGTTNAAGEEKWIEVSLDTQMLRAWEGNKVVMEYPISSGLWFPTPKGTYNIWYKTKFQRMKGGSQELGTFYDLPNVPNNMFFYQGYAIHGAYWHNNFGHPMSHGCVNEPLAQSEQLFNWAGPVLPPGQNVVRATPENPGTRVLVH